MTTQIVVTDAWLETTAAAAQAELNTGYTLRLFVNNHTPATNDTNPATYTEASYDSYAAVDLSSDFGSPTQVSTGLYQTQSTSHGYIAPTSGSQTVYGWFIDDGTDVVMAQLFDAPIPMVAGGAGFNLVIKYRDWAKSIL